MRQRPPTRSAEIRSLPIKGREVIEIKPPRSAHGELIEAFLAMAEAKKLVLPRFDWQAWSSTAEARQLCSGRETVARASRAELRRLITLVVRSGRFVEGAVEEAARSGLLSAIASRLKMLDHKP